MWCTYYINLLESVEKGELKLVNYDNLLVETRKEIQLLSDFLERQIIEDEFKVYSEQFLDINLRHNHQLLVPEKPIEIVSSRIKAALDNYNIKNETDEQALELDLAGLRNSLINADQELSSESSASKFKDLFSIYYKELEESKLIQKAIQAEFKETQDELERVKILRKAARKRYSEAMEEFKNLTKTFWWKASVPLRFLLSSRKERSILRSLYSRTKA